MNKKIRFENVDVDIEQTSKDLALMFAKVKLEEEIKNADLNDSSQQLDNLIENYYCALSYILTNSKNGCIKTLLSQAS